jgi:hypothetical protein
VDQTGKKELDKYENYDSKLVQKKSLKNIYRGPMSRKEKEQI